MTAASNDRKSPRGDDVAAPAPQGTTPEQPWPVRSVATKVAGWIDRLGAIWVEGQITQINVRPGTRTAFLVLRDPSVDMSLSVTCSPELIRNSPMPLAEGSRVVMFGKLTFYTGRGTVSLRVTEIRPVGIGELLARLEQLKAKLAAEGLFDPGRKKPIPFLPRTIGLITGRASAAERDVLSIAGSRWPAVRFELRSVAVQGPTAAAQIIDALDTLDRLPDVDVIVLARGGGSVEDLLPFSDEQLCRAIAAAGTPVVSAIGHEPDTPISDYVADLRAATPTDAAKRIVPDAISEQKLVAQLRDRCAGALRGWVHRETRVLDQLRTRPALADPIAALDRRRDEIDRLRDAARRDVRRDIENRGTATTHLQHRLAALGPAATLARGYAVVQRVTDGEPSIVRSVDDAPPGSQLRIRVVDGAVIAVGMQQERLTSEQARGEGATTDG